MNQMNPNIRKGVMQKQITKQIKIDDKHKHPIDITGYVVIDELHTKAGNVFLIKVAGIEDDIFLTRGEAEREAVIMRKVVCASIKKFLRQQAIGIK